MNTRLTQTQSESPDLLIVGASTRAAAASARRAGYRPLCVDQYGDQDLHALAAVIPRTSEPDGWLRVLAAYSSLEWIYTGGMENQRELISQISERHRLRGCGPDSLQRVRDPFFVEQLISGHPICMAPCLPIDAHPADPENWLCKPLRSAAGQGIRFLSSAQPDSLDAQNCYLQRYQPGEPLSALFIAFPGAVVLVGLALQFCGNPVLGARGFQFCGGVTISPVPDQLRSTLEDLGTTLAQGCGIQGLFGCDLIWHPSERDRLWLTEVNPRYTALTELFELQYRLPLLAWHLGACRSFHGDPTRYGSPAELQNQLVESIKQSFPQIAKGILYARQDRCAPDIPLPEMQRDLFAVPESADLPYPGTSIPGGTPFCSVYGTGRNQRESLKVLSDRLRTYQMLLAPEGVPERAAADLLTSLLDSTEQENHFFSCFFSSEAEGNSFLEESPH
ncbi:ATP-grasp domain-containing protein [Gimesia panareensis]|uniref:ATP-grasp domain-containing protein n=1 Tax=Gimesia panareensis TaxID=2527978 RepID=UPI001188E65C|nr:ATP-grasp domain-containing protein [Gimesia panareensis]QDU48761.1 ATP-grasp domain protein [Gimesia panareensis]